jgi:sigma-B regulation protein RsbU (phosphoserine phosphatase)
MFVTVFYAIYNIKTGEMEYSNGGHNSPVIIKADGSVEMLPTSTSCMVGAVSGITYPKETLKLGVGDTLVMYTDGVNEAMNEANDEYGDDRMMNFLGTQKGQGCRSIIDNQLANIKAFVGEAPQSDDITLMALTRKA